MTIKSILIGSSITVTLLSASCNNTSSTVQNNDSNGDVLPPVETKKANSDYPSAFAGQTRIAGVKTTTEYIVEKLASDLGTPWAVIPFADGRLLITEKTGHMQIRNADGSLAKKIEGFPAVDANGQGGMLDVALDPDFANNQLIYWSFSEKQNGGSLMAVAKGKLNEAAGKIENPSVIFRAIPAMESGFHFGSRLVFDKEGYLFASTGERSHLPGRVQAQDLKSGYGKIFRMDKDGNPAPNNPFINNDTALKQIYSYGHRNPQSLDFHPATGELWEAEFGPRGGDELNMIKAGYNYGWPIITYGIEYSGDQIGNPVIQQKDGLEQPVYYWDPVLSPSGMSFYAGNAIPEWENNLFIGGLSSQHIARLVIKDGKVVGEERLLADKKERFRDVAYYNGMLYTVTDGGTLYVIKKK